MFCPKCSHANTTDAAQCVQCQTNIEYLRERVFIGAGANAQTAYLPIESKELTVDVVAVRPGKGKLYASVHDMYDAEKVGTSPGVEMRVKK
jgi:hypothetical protein